jgi:AcrR family transcriptional regulator
VKERNSQETRKKILAAVGQLLAHSGGRGVGINAIAREAGVDKVLIYRYFGGLPRLLRAYAEEGDSWPSAQELLARVGEQGSRTDAEYAAEMLIEFGRAIRQRPVTQEIMRWELQERNELTDALARYREEQALELLAVFGNKGNPQQQAMAGVIGAGLTYLILRSKTVDVYNGLLLKDDEDWSRIEDSIRTLAQLAFGQSARRGDDAKASGGARSGTGRAVRRPPKAPVD